MILFFALGYTQVFSADCTQGEKYNTKHATKRNIKRQKLKDMTDKIFSLIDTVDG